MDWRVRLTFLRGGGRGRNGRFGCFSRRLIGRCCFRGNGCPSSTTGRRCGSTRCIRSADPIRQEVNGATIFILSIRREIRLDGAVIADVVAAKSFPDVVDDTVDVLFVILEKFLEGGAEVGRVGVSGGVVGVAFDAAGEDLLFEAVEAGGDALEVEGSGEGGGDGYLAMVCECQRGKL